MSERAGQEGPTPDFIPGWFVPREGNPDPATREAVRIPESADFFPITFLRASETVRNPRLPQRGFTIARVSEPGHELFDLAVPPGYWIVRDADGALRNWRDEDFKAKYVRLERKWTAPVERDVPSGRPAAAERNRHGALDPAVGDGEQLKPAETVRRALAATRREITSVPPEAWKGTPPAGGTRRHLIREAAWGAIKGWDLQREQGAGYSGATGTDALAIADAVESALLQSTIDDEAMARGAEALTAGVEKVPEHDVPSQTRELHVILEPINGQPGVSPDYRFVEIENQDGRSVELPWSVHPTKGDGFFRIVIPYGRDDAWVSEVAYQVAGAAIAALVDDLERRFDTRPAVPAERVRDAVAELLSDFGIPRACADRAEEEIGHGAKEAGDRRDAAIKSLQAEADRLLEGLEQARAGEDHWKAQRDAAFRLLQWVLPDLMGYPSDTLGADLAGDDAP